jgi:hypothetical protein
LNLPQKGYSLALAVSSPDVEVVEMLHLATRISAVFATLAVAVLGGTIKA